MVLTSFLVGNYHFLLGGMADFMNQRQIYFFIILI